MVYQKVMVSFVNLLIITLILFNCTESQNPFDKPLQLNNGPHLFIDDFLIADQYMLTRTVNNPEKKPEPIIFGGEDKDQNFQPYMTVLRDPDTGKYRIWYNTPENFNNPDIIHQSHIGYMESDDGINWIRPHRVLEDPHEVRYGVTVIDHGKDFTEPNKRFLLVTYGGRTQEELQDGGLMLATSADGLQWKALRDTAVFQHNHDINSLHWDPIRQHYVFFFSERQSSPRWEGLSRITHSSVSKDLFNWEKRWWIFEPKIGAPIEVGETQFYSMSGMIVRGDLLIGLVKILRDDLNATPGKTAKEMGDMDRKAAGIGYTVLAWSRDGRTWQRDHEPFIPINPVPGTWDHAHAWGDEQIIIGYQLYIYYGGYARGHKVARFNERHIGLATMPVDRYVSRDANLNWGSLITKPLNLNGSALTVNANIVGEIQIRLLDRDGNELKGFGWQTLTGDHIAHEVKWPANLNSIDKPVRIEFKMQFAQLFGFNLSD
jgi:hypothetical protein